MSGRYQIIAEDDDDDTPVARPASGGGPSQGPPQGGVAAPAGYASNAQGAPAGGAAPQQYITVLVPTDWQAGQHLMIPTANGNQVVSVPPGLSPGQQFRVPVPPVGQQLLNVQVPPGVAPGQQLTVRAPNNQLFTATVPPGHGPGSTFQMAIPRGSNAPNAPMSAGGVPPPAPQPPQRSPTEMAASAKDQATQMRETAVLLEAMLGSLEPGDNVQENELVQELVTQCQNSNKVSQRILEEVTDEAAMMQVLEANDAVMSALTKYESVLLSATPSAGGSSSAASRNTPVAPPPAAQEPAWLASNLGGGSAGGFPGAPPAAAPVPAGGADLLQRKPAVAPPPSEEDEMADMFASGLPMAAPAFAPQQPQQQQAFMQQPAFGMQQQGFPQMQQQGFPQMQQQNNPFPAPQQPSQGLNWGQPQMMQQPMQAAVPAMGGADMMAQERPRSESAASLIDNSTVVTPNALAAAGAKEDVALDDEANDLLAEFDDLIGSMEPAPAPAGRTMAPAPAAQVPSFDDFGDK